MPHSWRTGDAGASTATPVARSFSSTLHSAWSCCSVSCTLDVTLHLSAQMNKCAWMQLPCVTVPCSNAALVAEAFGGAMQKSLVSLETVVGSSFSATSGSVNPPSRGPSNAISAVDRAAAARLPTVALLCTSAPFGSRRVFLLLLKPVVAIAHKKVALTYEVSVKQVNNDAHRVVLTPRGDAALVLPDALSTTGDTKCYAIFTADGSSRAVTLQPHSEAIQQFSVRGVTRARVASACWRPAKQDEAASAASTSALLHQMELTVFTDKGYVFSFLLDSGATSAPQSELHFISSPITVRIAFDSRGGAAPSRRQQSPHTPSASTDFSVRWNHSDHLREALQSIEEKRDPTPHEAEFASLCPCVRPAADRLRVLAVDANSAVWLCQQSLRGPSGGGQSRLLLVSLPIANGSISSKPCVQPVFFPSDMTVDDALYTSNDVFRGFAVLTTVQRTPTVWFVPLSGIPAPAEVIPAQLASASTAFSPMEEGATERYEFVSFVRERAALSHQCAHVAVRSQSVPEKVLTSTMLFPDNLSCLQQDTLCSEASAAAVSAFGSSMHFNLLSDIMECRDNAEKSVQAAAELNYIAQKMPAAYPEAALYEYTEGQSQAWQPSYRSFNCSSQPICSPTCSEILLEDAIATLQQRLWASRVSCDHHLEESAVASAVAVFGSFRSAADCAGLLMMDTSSTSAHPALIRLLGAVVGALGELLEALQSHGSVTAAVSAVTQLTTTTTPHPYGTLWAHLVRPLFDVVVAGTADMPRIQTDLLPHCSPALQDMLSGGRSLLAPTLSSVGQGRQSAVSLLEDVLACVQGGATGMQRLSLEDVSTAAERLFLERGAAAAVNFLQPFVQVNGCDATVRERYDSYMAIYNTTEALCKA